MSSPFQLVSSSRCFGGKQEVYTFYSQQLQSDAQFSCFLPPKVVDSSETKVPVIYYLSGVGNTVENFILKSGFQRYAAQYNCIVIGPDTSPRGAEVEALEDGEEKDIHFGTGASFYLDATTEKFNKHYRMYSYFLKELFPSVEAHFPVLENARSITGYSMGGHGALNLALKNPGLFKSVGLLAPLCHPTAKPMFNKLLLGYLGENQDSWKDWDAIELLKKYKGPPLNLRIDQGAVDPAIELLMSKNFAEVYSQVTGKDVGSFFHLHDDYDHSYYFVASFIGEHIKYHVQFLNKLLV